MTSDAVMIASFGGPEGPGDVMPFLENVLRGKNVPEERKKEVAHHYEMFGGVSPINAQNRELKALLEKELSSHHIDLPVYWGNRNWNPFFPETLREMKLKGIQRVFAFVTSAYSSFSGCRQYLEDFARARAEVGEGAPEIAKLRGFYNHPNFVEANIARIQEALAKFPADCRRNVHVAFTAHSVPLAMSLKSDYLSQLTAVAGWVAETIAPASWKLIYQSRSGPPQVPWLAPDIRAHLESIRGEGVRDVLIAPIGFLSDHMEVCYDLDVEAKELADRLGIRMVRSATVGNHPLMVTMIRELIEERLGTRSEYRTMKGSTPRPEICAPDCCPMR